MWLSNGWPCYAFRFDVGCEWGRLRVLWNTGDYVSVFKLVSSLLQFLRLQRTEFDLATFSVQLLGIVTSLIHRVMLRIHGQFQIYQIDKSTFNPLAPRYWGVSLQLG